MKFIRVITISFFYVIVGCNSINLKFSDNGAEFVEPDGKIIQKNIDVDMFRYLEIDLNANIELIQSDSINISIKGYKNIIELIDVSVSNSKMIVKFKKSIIQNNPLDIKIFVPAIQSVLINGSGNFKINSWENEEKLVFKNNGSSKFFVSNLKNIKHLVVELNGGGSIEGYGECKNINALHCTLNGSGNLNFEQINTISAIIESNGSGNVEVGIAEILNASIIGSGNISYKGFPKIHQKIIGSGTILQK